MSQQPRAAIIGAGELGQALGGILRQAGRFEVKWWDREAGKVPDQQPLPETVKKAGAILLCVPSEAVRPVAEQLKDLTAADSTIISLAKGLEAQTGKTMSQVLAESWPGKRAASLIGPMLAEEMAAGKPAAAVAGGSDEAAGKAVKDLFQGTTLRVELTADWGGITWAGVLKNIYAFGLGMVEEWKLGSNFRGWYVTEALAEISQWLVQEGHDQMTAYGLAGLGDLIATGSSDFSSNFQAGRQLAAGEEMKVSEGVKSLPIIGRRPEIRRYPLLNYLKQAVQAGQADGNTFKAILK